LQAELWRGAGEARAPKPRHDAAFARATQLFSPAAALRAEAAQDLAALTDDAVEQNRVFARREVRTGDRTPLESCIQARSNEMSSRIINWTFLPPEYLQRIYSGRGERLIRLTRLIWEGTVGFHPWREFASRARAFVSLQLRN